MIRSSRYPKCSRSCHASAGQLHLSARSVLGTRHSCSGVQHSCRHHVHSHRVSAYCIERMDGQRSLPCDELRCNGVIFALHAWLRALLLPQTPSPMALLQYSLRSSRLSHHIWPSATPKDRPSGRNLGPCIGVHGIVQVLMLHLKVKTASNLARCAAAGVLHQSPPDLHHKSCVIPELLGLARVRLWSRLCRCELCPCCESRISLNSLC